MPGAPSLATIGIYGSDLERFLAALESAGVALLVDVRQRRAVRGSQYAWANAQRLQASLRAAGVTYLHRRDLAPTTELRQLQYAEDEREGVGKRSRVELAPAYRERYTREILSRADLDSLQWTIEALGPAALMCVERDAAACHRSLVAACLQERTGVRIHDLLP